ncbi:MAG: hypothetical protein DIZ80_04580 [endosymbiont of Galathealinum brachiosum]|uniref:ANTAR domain-containing protein n=1 Tax=endosymbiont of Galathealinum brachiosum TaxID=2200906 RepID=A0A370DIJ8_9GAMM|nr:MAG: hypothetical protein DIZ80_04580 [endosymbiont of Galathealinum brachiosum]
MNITLIYESVEHQNKTAMLLVDAGYTINKTCDTESQWFDDVKKDTPDVLIISVSSPNRKLFQQLGNFKGQVICPVIVLANTAEINITQDVILAGADSCVTGNIAANRIQSLIEICLARFKVTRFQIEEIEGLNKNIESLESRLSDRKDIEKAKGMLMNSYNMNEDDAYNAMRRMAMDTGNKLGDVSRNIISMSNILN